MPPKNPVSPSRVIPLPPRLIRVLVTELLAWYDANLRDLPWRHSRDPYAILVSEFMLQQTQVATVIPYYERFLKAFPTVEALAEADEQEVLRLWAGLGYYSRARNLQGAARKIVAEYDGHVPSRVGDLLFLPGVGAYVAGAVASIAFGEPVPAIDANVVRVISRLFAIAEISTSPKTRREIESLTARLVPQERAGDFNQALMELGALICPSSSPACEKCPWNAHCEARRKGNPQDYPALPPRAETVEVEEACALLKRDNAYLVVQRPEQGGRYRGFWEFPGVEVQQDGSEATGEPDLFSPEPTPDKARETLAEFLKTAYGLDVRVEAEWAEIRHQVTHHKIRKRVFLCSLAPAQKAGKRQAQIKPEMMQWATLLDIRQLPLGAPQQRIVKLLEEQNSLFLPLE